MGIQSKKAKKKVSSYKSKSRGFIKSQALGKLSSCEDFARLAGPFVGVFLTMKFPSKPFTHLCKRQ